MNKLMSACLISLLTLCAASSVLAFEAAGRESVIVKEPVAEDLLAAGETVRIAAAVDGDVAVAGAHVAIEAPIAGYTLAAGREVEVTGTVGDDLWAAGATVNVGAPVGDNAMLAGRDVNLEGRAQIAGDLRIAGTNVAVHAPIEGDLQIGAQNARLGSEVRGSVEAHATTLSLLPGALIRGDLIVHGPNRPEIPLGAQVLGQVRFDEIEGRGVWAWLGYWLFLFVALVVVGLVALALFPVWAGRVAGAIRERPGVSALTGLIGLLLTPVIIALLLMTVVGIPLALILFALYAVAILLSGVFVAYRVGGSLLGHTSRPWLRIALGALAVSFAISLPWVGWIAQLIVLITGFGALTRERWHSRQEAQAAA